MNGPITVLHVDDDSQFTALTGQFLARENEQISTVASTGAKEALDYLSDPSATIDCIVSDYALPESTGLELLEAVRERCPDLPFILFTGKGSEEVASEAISAGVTDYLQKEGGVSQYDILANRIVNSVENHRAQNELQRQNHAFDEFFRIVNDPSLSFDQRITEVLSLGGEFLDLDNGIVSNIEPPAYTVEHVVTPDGCIEEGAVLDFGDTFCELVYEADGPVAFRSPQVGEVEDHPGYRELGLAAYLGEPLIVDGDRYGTLHFSSAEPREEPFTRGERAFIRTVAGWVSKELGRHQREEEIHRLGQLHRTVLSNMRETVLLTDDTGEITYVCPNVHFIFGYDDEDVAEMGSISDLLGEPILPPDALEAAGELRNVETTVTDQEGNTRTVLITVTQVSIEDGSRLYSIRDVTERVYRNQELVEERQFIDQALDALSDVFFLIEPDGELRRWNERVSEVTGHPTDAIAEMNALDFFPDDERAAVVDAIEAALETGEATVEADVLTVDGARIPFEFRGVRLTEANGDPLGIVGIGRERTPGDERADALEELHSATRDLMVASTREDVAEIGSETAETVLGLPMNGVHLYDPTEEALTPVAWTDTVEQVLDSDPPTIPVEDSLAGRVYVDDDPASYVDLQNADATLNRDTPLRSELILPLGEHGVVLAGSRTPDDFDASDRTLGQVLAANIESALDRVTREEELIRQRSLLTAQRDAVLDGLLVVDESREVISYNDRFLDLWDIPEAIVEEGDDSHAFEAAVDQLADPDAFRNTVDYLYDHPAATEIDELRLADGRVYELYTTPLTADDGPYLGRLWAFRDVTERKERLREINRERNRFEAVFEAIPEPTVHVVFEGSDPVIQHVNDAFEAVFGYDADEARGESVDELIVPTERHAEATDINESLRETGLYQMELRRETATGDRPFLFRAQTMELDAADNGRVEGVGTYVDLSEQKRREDELARRNERLDEFATILSHDLRNPLNVAGGRLELAQDECDSDHLEVVAGALDRMDALIEDMLALAREGDRIDDREPVDLAEVAENCWQNVATAEATLVVATDLTIRADRRRVKQLMENLFRNAVSHGGDGVEITVGELEEPTGFFVADDGSGIPPAKRAAVFEPGVSHSKTGTGLGLPIVKRIAEAHGWEITLVEGPDGGARFEFGGVSPP